MVSRESSVKSLYSCVLESTPSRRPLKRRRSNQENVGDNSIEFTGFVLKKQPETNTPKSSGQPEDSDLESEEEMTPSLRRVRSMPLSKSSLDVDLKTVGRVASLAAARTAATPQAELKSPGEPVARSASLEALMVDAEALAQLDIKELLRQQEMLAAMREQVAKALALKQVQDAQG